MNKIAKTIKNAVTTALNIKAEEPMKTEEPKKNEPAEVKKAKVNMTYKVACPSCSHEFELDDYDPTYKKAEDEKPEDVKEDETKMDAKEDEKKAEVKEDEKKAEVKEEPKEEEKKAEVKEDEKKAELPDWNTVAFGGKTINRANAFRNTVEAAFKNIVK